MQSELFATSTDQKQYTWENVRQRLKNGEVAIEIIKTSKKKNGKDASVYAALIVTTQTRNQPDLVMLENGDELDNKFRKYYCNAAKNRG